MSWPRGAGLVRSDWVTASALNHPRVTTVGPAGRVWAGTSVEIFGTTTCWPHAPVKCHVSAFISYAGMRRADEGPAGSACAWLQQSLIRVPSVCLLLGTGAAARLKTGWVGWSRLSGASPRGGFARVCPGIPALMSCENALVPAYLSAGSPCVSGS
jgi:hypothetical protein